MKLKKAFTLIELIFVIVIIGILSAVLVPRFDRPTLIEAAHQVISHIRYTQHLAMVDNRFNPNDSQWFQGRWQIRFFKDVKFDSMLPHKEYDDIWSYAIYSDNPTYTHLPNLNELARNPQNSSQYMCGGYNNTLHVEDENSMKEMRLGFKYGIKSIKFKNGCRGGINHIQFDYLGRPFNNYITTSNPYGAGSSSYQRLIRRRCEIDICIVDDCTTAAHNEKITIAIEPETGYTHIL